MPTDNKFFQFAGPGGSGAILTDAAYDSDTERTNGVPSGQARSNLFNKQSRQNSTISAVIGQLIANYEAVDEINDQLTVAQLVAKLETAILAVSPVMSVTTIFSSAGVTSGTQTLSGGAQWTDFQTVIFTARTNQLNPTLVVDTASFIADAATNDYPVRACQSGFPGVDVVYASPTQFEVTNYNPAGVGLVRVVGIK